MTQAVSAHKEQACICRDLGTPRGLSLKQANDLFWLQNNFLSVTDLLLHSRLLLGSVIRVLEKDWRRKNSSAPLLLCFSILSNCFSSDPSPCSVTQSCPTLCNPMDCSTPGFPVHHQLPELAQTHVHRVSDAIQPSHPLLFPSPPAFNLSQQQGLSHWVSSSHLMLKDWSFSISPYNEYWKSFTLLGTVNSHLQLFFPIFPNSLTVPCKVPEATLPQRSQSQDMGAHLLASEFWQPSSFPLIPQPQGWSCWLQLLSLFPLFAFPAIQHLNFPP